MLRFFALVSLLALCAPLAPAQQAPKAVLVIHGGAGTILRENMTPERDAEYRAALTEALRAGYAILQKNGTSMDAIVAAIQTMETSPLFNAGRGAVLTDAGTAELDASIMDGRTRAAGAVAGVTTVRSPIALARRVMEASPHVMMVGQGAETFAKEHGLEQVENSYFVLPERREQLRRMMERQRQTGYDPRSSDPYAVGGEKYGTVGAVALDRSGNLAAGTSTGGMMGKKWGRVGDAPIIGAGTYADNETCGVSATGHGEYFIRGVVAHDVASMMRYGGLSLKEAANAVVMGRLDALGGTGGIIALDREGNVAMPFNTPGMYRGYIDEAGKVTVHIYKGEE